MAARCLFAPLFLVAFANLILFVPVAGGNVPGEGLEFDGVSQAVVIEDFPLPEPGAFSVGAWVRLDGMQSPQVFVNRGERGELFTLYLFRDRIRMLVEYEPGRYTYASAELPEPETWVHYLGTYDGESIRLYVDGKLADEAGAAGGIPVREDPVVAGAKAAGDSVLRGRLEDVRIYDRVLSPGEAQELVSGGHFDPQGLLLQLSGSDMEDRVRSFLPPGAKKGMDYGPVIAESIEAQWPEGNRAMKGLAVRAGDGYGMIFDTDLLRWASATRDGWVDISLTAYMRYRDAGLARTEGTEVFGTGELPGWAGADGFTDPREGGRGPLPHGHARWKGYYRYGDRILLHYTVSGADVHEMPRAFEAGGAAAFVRTLDVSGTGARRIYVCELPDGAEVADAGPATVTVRTEDGILVAGLAGAPAGAEIRVAEGARLEARLPAGKRERPFHLFVAEVPGQSGLSAVVRSIRERLERNPVDFDRIRSGGPARWDRELIEKVTLSGDDSGYVADRIGLPEDNPWDSWIRPTGFDFFSDGRSAAVSTWNGDVWIVSGFSDEMSELRWRRFASGLYAPLGLAIVDDVIHVTERGQLTRLHDLNGNGEADFYENFNNDSFVHRRAHALCLEVDSAGNFYFFKNGNRVPADVPDHGALFRVPPDGSTREVFATGIRGANTLAIGPDDTIMGADQEGNWVPSTRVDHYQKGGYYGFPRHREDGTSREDLESPVCWIPHQVDNSTGAMAHAGDSRWGPLAGNFVLGSYGRGTLFVLLTEEIGAVMQGGVVPFPLEFASGPVRARVNPADGQLYVLGMRGWGTSAREDGSFDRVRFAGGASRLPTELNVSPDGVALTFSEPLDRAVAEDSESYRVQRWQYRYTRRYGSPEVSVADPGAEGRDPVEVAAASLSEDGRTVVLEIPDIAPVMQQSVEYRLRFAGGEEVENTLYHTIHLLAEGDEPARHVRSQLLAQTRGEEDEVESDSESEDDDFGDQPEWLVGGREHFEMNCATCHSPGGVAPVMKESEWAAGSQEALVRILLHGKEGDRSIMTPFGWMDDEEMAAILSYIRVRWHDKEPIDASEIRRIREESADREDLWTDEELRHWMQ